MAIALNCTLVQWRCVHKVLTLPERQAHAVELNNWKLVPWMLEFASADKHTVLMGLLTQNTS